MSFATGKFALGICDRCGQQYKLLQLKKEWTGIFACPECWEPKHPQLDPPYHAADAIAVKNPRPSRIEPMTVYVGAPGNSAFTSDCMLPSEQDDDLLMPVRVGKVTIVIS